jgi:hypothetical protein
MTGDGDALTFKFTGNYAEKDTTKTTDKKAAQEAAHEADKIGKAAAEKVKAALATTNTSGPFADILKAVKNAEVTSEGSQVTATVTVSVATVGKVAKVLTGG